MARPEGLEPPTTWFEALRHFTETLLNSHLRSSPTTRLLQNTLNLLRVNFGLRHIFVTVVANPKGQQVHHPNSISRMLRTNDMLNPTKLVVTAPRLFCVGSVRGHLAWRTTYPQGEFEHPSAPCPANAALKERLTRLSVFINQRLVSRRA